MAYGYHRICHPCEKGLPFTNSGLFRRHDYQLGNWNKPGLLLGEQHARSGNIRSGRRGTSPHPFGQGLPLSLAGMEQPGLGRSMSKKGCSPNNSACEGLEGRLKNEMFYNKDWTGFSIQEFINILNEYLVWYNEKRIKTSLGNMNPREYRQSLGLVA